MRIILQIRSKFVCVLVSKLMRIRPRSKDSLSEKSDRVFRELINYVSREPQQNFHSKALTDTPFNALQFQHLIRQK